MLCGGLVRSFSVWQRRCAGSPWRGFGLTLAAAASCTRASPLQTPEGPSSAAMTAGIDSLFAAYTGTVPGASLIVIRDGAPVVARSYGLSDLDARTPVTQTTNFRLASLTKQFTATAVLLLVKEGRVTLDDRVRDILPELPAYAADVRVRHLLTHTSGLWAYEDFVPDSQTTQVHDRDVPGLIARADSLYFPPGSAFRYSNTGYALLALIVERRSGTPFARFLRTRIFEPLGMTSTVAHESGVSAVPHRAFGYSIESGTGKFLPTDQSSTSAVLGDGGIYSSVNDLALWDAALDRHALVDDATQRAIWTPMVLTGGATTRYGFGWFIDNAGDDLGVSHHGETMGFTNFIIKYPRRRLTVVVLTNRSGGAPWDIAIRVARLFGGPPVGTP